MSCLCESGRKNEYVMVVLNEPVEPATPGSTTLWICVSAESGVIPFWIAFHSVHTLVFRHQSSVNAGRQVSIYHAFEGHPGFIKAFCNPGICS